MSYLITVLNQNLYDNMYETACMCVCVCVCMRGFLFSEQMYIRLRSCWNVNAVYIFAIKGNFLIYND